MSFGESQAALYNEVRNDWGFDNYEALCLTPNRSHHEH